MADSVGIRLGVDGEKAFKASLAAVNSQLKSLGAEMLAVTASFTKNADSQEALAAKNTVLGKSIDMQKSKVDLLNKQIEAQKGKLDALGSALDKASAEYGENSDQALKAQNAYNRQAKTVGDLTTQLHKAEAELSGMSAAMEDNNDALAGGGKSMDELADGARNAADGLKGAGKAGLSFGDIIKANVISEAVVGGIRALGDAMKTVAGAALDLAKESISGFSQYEQLAGGVKTLFGTEAASLEEYANSVGKSAEEVAGEYEKLLASQQTVFDNADKAFQSAGLSANEYMETVTSFSASLLQGLGGDTEKAAALADKAIIDMADNANKMGTDIGSIQNAYQGFAKQNYTMLDNLKLGYGGTQEEMVRLINDSGILEKKIEDLDGIRFDQVVEAVHAVQTNIGITGTTAQEASSTIEGSVNAMKSAWSNLVSGMARDDADLSGLMSDLAGSVETAGANLLPRITTILSSMGTLVAQLAPQIAGQVPHLIEQVVPPMIEAGAQMLGGVATGLIQALPGLLSYAGEALTGLRDSFLEMVPSLAQGIQEKTPEFISAGLDLLGGLASSLRENAGMAVDAMIELAKGLAQGIADGIPAIIEKAPQIVSDLANTINDNAPKIFAAAWDIIKTLGKGLIDAIPTLIANIPQIISAISDTITAFNWLNLGKTIITALGNGIKAMVSLVKSAGTKIKDAIAGGIKKLPDEMLKIGKNIVKGVWDGISAMGDWIKTKVSDFFGGIVDGVKGLLGIHSPSKLFKEEIGENIGLGVAEGISDSGDKAVKAADKMAKDVYERSKTWAERQTKYQKLTLQEQLDLWKTIQGQFIKESKQYAEAEEKIFDIKAQMQEEYSKKVEDVNKRITDLEKEYLDALSNRTDKIFNSYKLFDKAADKEEVSGRELIGNLQSQVERMQEFYDGLRELSARGVGDALVEEIRDMGPSAAAQLDALLELSDLKLSEYADLYKRKQQLANQEAVEQLSALRTETNRQIRESLNEISNVYGQSAAALGEMFTGGLADGMLGNLDTVADAAKAATSEAISAAGQAMANVIKSVGGIEYEPDVDYGKLMLAARNLEEFEELAAKRNAKIVGENLNLIEKGYSDNAQLLAQWQSMQARAKEQSVQTVDALAGTVSDTLRSFLDDTPEMGRQFSEQLAEGIRSGMSAVISASADVARAAAETARQILSTGIPSLQADVAPAMASGRGSRDGQIVDMLSRAVQNASGGTGSIDYAELGRTVYGAVRDGLSGAGVYLEGRRVGKFVSDWQGNENMAMGR